MASNVTRMHQTGDRRAGTRAEVRRRASNRSRDGNATHERRDDVGHPLRHELGVRIMPIARHRVGDDRGEQTLHRGQQRHRHGRRQQRQDQIDAERGDVDRRKAARDRSELRADRLHRQLKGDDRDRAEDECHDRTGHARQPPRYHEHERQRADAQRQRRRMERVHRLDEQFHPREKLARWVTDAQAKEVFDLGGGNQQGDAVGEPQDDGPRNELDRLAEAGDRQEQQDDARHHRDHQQAGQAVRGDDARDDHHERPRRSADLNA